MQASPDALREQAALLESIALVAVEYESVLDLSRLVAFIDLYARCLQPAAGGADRPTFEAFVRDRAALGAAADLAERDTGVPAVAPEPLGPAVESG